MLSGFVGGKIYDVLIRKKGNSAHETVKKMGYNSRGLLLEENYGKPVDFFFRLAPQHFIKL